MVRKLPPVVEFNGMGLIPTRESMDMLQIADVVNITSLIFYHQAKFIIIFLSLLTQRTLNVQSCTLYMTHG